MHDCEYKVQIHECISNTLDIPGSSLGVPSETGPHTAWRIPWTSRDPPLVSPQTQVPMHAVQGIPWTSQDPPLVSPQTQAPMLSGGSLDTR